MVLFRSVREYDPQFGKNSSEDEEEGQEEKRDAQRCLEATARVPEGSRGPEGAWGPAMLLIGENLLL